MSKTKMWGVYGKVTGSTYLGRFEGKTKEDAIQAASESDAASPTFCWQCSSGCEDPTVTGLVAELDE